VANLKRQLDDKYVDETFDEYYDRLYGKDTKERKTKPTFGDDTGKGFGGAGKKSDRDKPVSQRELSFEQRAEAAEAPVRRAEERIRREIAEEAEAKKQGKRIPKYYKAGGSVSASKRADGCARRGKTRGRMV
jgi:hypothetical protein